MLQLDALVTNIYKAKILFNKTQYNHKYLQIKLVGNRDLLISKKRLLYEIRQLTLNRIDKFKLLNKNQKITIILIKNKIYNFEKTKIIKFKAMMKRILQIIQIKIAILILYIIVIIWIFQKNQMREFQIITQS